MIVVGYILILFNYYVTLLNCYSFDNPDKLFINKGSGMPTIIFTVVKPKPKPTPTTIGTPPTQTINSPVLTQTPISAPTAWPSPPTQQNLDIFWALKPPYKPNSFDPLWNLPNLITNVFWAVPMLPIQNPIYSINF